MKYDLTTIKDKNFLKIFIVVIFAIFAFVVYINVLVNPKKIKTEINAFFGEEISKYTENYNLNSRRVVATIDGDISFKLFPKAILNISNIKFENIYYKNISLNSNIRNIVVELRLIPLIFGKIKIKNISINSSDVNLNVVNLLTEYKKKVTEDKIVDVGENEVSGIGKKIKNIIGVDENKELEESGKKIIQVEVEKTIPIDNSDLYNMFTNIAGNFNKNFLGNGVLNGSGFNINDATIALYKESKLLKEINNVHGFVNLKTRKISADLNYIIEQEAISNTINYAVNKNDDVNINLKFRSKNIIDDLMVNFSGKIDDLFDINKWNGILNTSLKFKNIHDFANIVNLTYQNNNLSFNKDNKDVFNVNVKIELKNGLIRSDNISVNSKNLKFSANFNKTDDGTKIYGELGYLNFNNVFVKSEKYSEFEPKPSEEDSIFIFNFGNNINLLTDKLNKTTTNKVGIKTELTIDSQELVFNDILFKNNKADISISDSGVSFNRLQLNNDDYSINISNPRITNGIYINDIDIHLAKSKKIFDTFSWIKDIDKEKEFDIAGNLIVNDNTLLLVNSNIKSGDNNISFSFEHYFGNTKKKYTAVKLNINEGELNHENKEGSIKQRLLFLSELQNNFYLNLVSNKFKFNGAELTNFKVNLRSSAGYLFLKNLTFNSNDLKNFSGNLELDITKNLPIINLNFSASNYSKKINLIPYLIDLEKYQKLLGGEKEGISYNSYWVKKIFDIVSFEGVNGTLKGNIDYLNINTVSINKFNFDVQLNDGNFNINKFNCDLQDGNVNISGDVSIRDSERSINFKVDKNIYSLFDLNKLITGSIDSVLSGLVGVGGYFSASGGNINDFSSSISSYFEFVGNNVYVKNFGLTDLREKLSNIHTKKDILFTIEPKEVLIGENNGTMFKKINGKFYSQLNVYKSEVEASGDGVNNKFNLTINNSDNKTIIDMLNASVMVVLVNKTKIPLYAYISYKENVKDKATLDFNLSNIEEYLEKVRSKVKEAEEQKLMKEKEKEQKALLEKQKEEEFINTEGQIIKDITENLEV